MTSIVGIEQFEKNIESFGKAVKARAERMLEEELLATQKDAADLVPVHTGKGRRMLLSPDAVIIDVDDKGWRGKFGFVTKALRDAAYYLFWVEFGTKGYAAGDTRDGGKDKRGNQIKRKVRRDVPAHAAHPFFRPAVENLKRRLAAIEPKWRDVVAAGKQDAGLADKS